MKKKYLQQLGFSESDKLLMINADDLGLCHAENVGTFKCFTDGFLTSASIIVCAPWAAEAFQWSRQHPQYCVGIEVAITCECRNMRWGPISSKNEVPSLLAPDGYFWSSVKDCLQHAKVGEVEREIRAQIEYFRSMGIEPTHILNHMDPLFHRADLYEVFVRVATEYKLPCRDPKFQDNPGWPSIDKSIGFNIYFIGIDDGKEAALYEELSTLGPGLYELYPHPAEDTAELRASCGFFPTIPEDPNNWVGRVGDLELYTMPRVRKWIEDHGFKLIDWRPLRDAIRKNY